MENNYAIKNNPKPAARLMTKIKNVVLKVVNWAKSDKIWPLVLSKIETIIIWLIIFVVDEIIISGGRHQQNSYLFAFNIIALLMLFGYANIRRATRQMAEVLKRAGIAVLVFAILDFLVIDLLLEKNNLSIYKSWQAYVMYAVIFLITLAVSRFKKVRSVPPPQEIPLDKP